MKHMQCHKIKKNPLNITLFDLYFPGIIRAVYVPIIPFTLLSTARDTAGVSL
jgi:hypothetical protein